MAVSVIGAPRWTIPSFHQSPGRYPLGLEAVGMSQLDQLAFGIPVLFRHPRYWSIYTYAIKQFWDRGYTPQNMRGLAGYMRTREIAFACAALLCPRHPELAGVVGQTKLGDWLRNHPNDSDGVPLDIDYLQQAMGGYGQIYRGGMIDIGLILASNDNPKAPVDAPLGELGAEVADLFSTAIEATAYSRKYADQVGGSIPLGVLKELAEASCFCRLRDFPAERNILTDVLLGRPQQPLPQHATRATTVRMLLQFASFTSTEAVNDWSYREYLYYRSTGEGMTWSPSAELEPIWRRWWMVQLREFVVASLNALFVHFVRWGKMHGGLLAPLRLSEYVNELAELEVPLFPHGPSGCIRHVPLTELATFLDSVVARESWPVDRVSGDIPRESRLVLECAGGTKSDAPVLAGMALLLAQRRIAFRQANGGLDASEAMMLQEGMAERGGSGYVFQRLENCLRRGDSLHQALAEMVQLFVVRQHLRIARTKLPEDTFRFYQEDGGLRFVDFGDAGLSSINVRFEALAETVAELGLIAAPLGEAFHEPTERGQGVLHA